MGSKKRSNGKTAEPIPAAATPVVVEDQDLQAMFNANPIARLQTENFALKRTLVQKDIEILELTKRLGKKAGV